MSTYDYLLKQGWSLEDAKRYIEMQEKGMSPQKAFESVRGGANSEAQIKVEHVYEQEPQTEKVLFEPQTTSEKIFGRPVKVEEVETAVGKGIDKLKSISKEELQDLKNNVKRISVKSVEVPPKKQEKVLRKVYKEQPKKQQKYFKRFQQPVARVKIVRVMKPGQIRMMINDDMGMLLSVPNFSVDIGNAPSLVNLVNYNLRNSPRVKTRMPRKVNPTNDDTGADILGLKGFY